MTEVDKNPTPKKRKVPFTDIDFRRAAKIASIIERKKLKRQQLADILGVDITHFNKLVGGKYLWKTYYLEKLAPFLDCTVADLLIPDHVIRISAELTADGFNYRTIEVPEGGLGVASIPLDLKTVEGLYCLKIGANGASPFNPDSILYVQAGSGTEVKDGDFVIWVDDNGFGHLKIAKFSGDFLILSSPYPGKPDVVKPKKYVSSLDRVHSIKF